MNINNKTITILIYIILANKSRSFLIYFKLFDVLFMQSLRINNNALFRVILSIDEQPQIF